MEKDRTTQNESRLRIQWVSLSYATVDVLLSIVAVRLRTATPFFTTNYKKRSLCEASISNVVITTINEPEIS
jgi:Na+/melibiose symporter-like transporter